MVFQEVYPPKLCEFAYVTDGACTENEILHQELIILKVCHPCPLAPPPLPPPCPPRSLSPPVSLTPLYATRCLSLPSMSPPGMSLSPPIYVIPRLCHPLSLSPCLIPCLCHPLSLSPRLSVQTLKWDLAPMTVNSWLNIYLQLVNVEKLEDSEHNFVFPQYSAHSFVQIMRVSVDRVSVCTLIL